MTEFTWVPIYDELAHRILEYENRQPELLAMLREAADAGLPVLLLRDRDERGEHDLAVMEPFTFFACFNRNIKTANRTGILEHLKARLSLTSAVPTDFVGIPSAQNQASWFFGYASKRRPGDIPALWALARAAVGNGAKAIPAETFNNALEVHSVGFPKLTMGLYWLDPKNYLPCDANTLAYLKARGVGEPSARDHAGYVDLIDRVRRLVGDDFLRISADAYHFKAEPQTGRRSWAGGILWGKESKLREFLEGEYWQIGSPRDGGAEPSDASEAVEVAQLPASSQEPSSPDGTSNVDLMQQLVAEGASDDRILEVFTQRYATQGKTDPKWVADRVNTYRRMAEKRVADTAATTTSAAVRRCWTDFASVSPGDRFALKGFGGRNDLVVYAIGTVKSVDHEAGRLTVDGWDDRTERRLKAPRLELGSSWFTTLVPVTGADAIRRVFGSADQPGSASAPGHDTPQTLKAIQDYFDSCESCVYSPDLVARLHAALHALARKRFVLLTGLSGTGKTLLTKIYAHAYHDIPIDDSTHYYRVIPVRPNWNTPRDLLGYYNPIVGRYETTPFLDVLLEAADDPDNAYFVVLDEMNLAPVEHYFSDVLSAMESGQTIPLWSGVKTRPHASWTEESGIGKETVRQDLVLWALERQGGRATTDQIWQLIEDHPIHGEVSSPRNSMRRKLQELRDAGLVDEFEVEGVWGLRSGARDGRVPASLTLPQNVFLIGTVNMDETTHAFSDKVLDRAFTLELWDVDWKTYRKRIPVELQTVQEWVMPALEAVHSLLAQVHLDFGYRTADEVLRYVAGRLPGVQNQVALDEALMMKVLPKLRGDSQIEAMLGRLHEELLRRVDDTAASVRAVQRMRDELRTRGSTRFWR